MAKQIRFWLLVSAILMVMTACGKMGPLLGFSADRYVNEKDPGQILELNAKETLKGFVSGQFINPRGWFVLTNQDKTTSGEYTLTNGTFVLKAGDRELKIVLQRDATLRDETGAIWKHEFHSRMFRPPDVASNQ